MSEDEILRDFQDLTREDRPAGVRLLLDQNSLPVYSQPLTDLYPGSTHAREVGLQAADDDAVWQDTAQQGFAIV